MQRRTAVTPTLVCLLLHHDSAGRPRHGDCQRLHKIWVGTFLVHNVQSRERIPFVLILMVKMIIRHPVQRQFGSEFLAICNHCGVMTSWSCKTWKFCEHFFWKNDTSQTVATAQIAPKICQGHPPHFAHAVQDFIQIGSLSAELLPNA